MQWECLPNAEWHLPGQPEGHALSTDLQTFVTNSQVSENVKDAPPCDSVAVTAQALCKDVGQPSPEHFVHV